MKTLPVALIALLFPFAAGASTLYKCTDGDGAVLFTNQKTGKKGCEVISHVSPPAPGGSAGSSGGSRPKASSNPTPADFPRVSNNEQKHRDNDRKAILDKELANEQQNLDKAKKAVAEAGNQPADKLQSLRDVVSLHERNVDALKKELANLR